MVILPSTDEYLTDSFLMAAQHQSDCFDKHFCDLCIDPVNILELALDMHKANKKGPFVTAKNDLNIRGTIRGDFGDCHKSHNCRAPPVKDGQILPSLNVINNPETN
jgi:hypothetical protein